jgi:hypothetical protein
MSKTRTTPFRKPAPSRKPAKPTPTPEAEVIATFTEIRSVVDGICDGIARLDEIVKRLKRLERTPARVLSQSLKSFIETDIEEAAPVFEQLRHDLWNKYPPEAA